MYKVSSEIYSETNFQPVKSENGKVLSKFKFCYPTNDENVSAAELDKDGDLIVSRRPKEKYAQINIEHLDATNIQLVGLQVWRGALLLADYLFHCREDFREKQLLELGAGVGLTSIAAAVFLKRVVCTDIDIGGILDQIRANVERNQKLFTEGANVQVIKYDFKQQLQDYAPELMAAIDASDIVVAADVIYDDSLTDAFIEVIDTLFQRATISGRSKTIFVALEKRYVFTLSELDSVAPMYEYFLKRSMNKPWRCEYIPLDFPQYFDYERCKQLVLFKLTHK